MPRFTSGMFAPVLGFLGLPKWLTDPWGYIRDKLIDLYQGLGSLFDKWVIHPPGPLPGSWQDSLYSNALGLSIGLSAAVLVTLLVVSMFFPKKLVSAGKSLIVAVFIGSMGPLFYAAANWFVKAGDDLTAGVSHFGAIDTQKLLLLPDINNVFGAIGGISIISFLGGLLVLIFLIYQLATILVTFFGLPLLALYPIGRVPQTALRWAASMGIMAILLGRPLGSLELRATSLAVNSIPQQDQSNFVAVAFLAAALLVAIATQVGLVYLAHKGYSAVEGAVRANSWVRGRIETTSRDTVKVEVDRVNDRFAGRMAAVAALRPEAALISSERLRRPSVSSSMTINRTRTQTKQSSSDNSKEA